MPRVVIASASDSSRQAELPCQTTRFLPTYRLRKPAEFSAVFRARKVLRGNCFTVHLLDRPITPPGATGARLGLIVPKKLLRTAVARNRTKRIVRELFRQNRSGLPDSDFVFRLVARPGPSSRAIDRKTVRAEVERLIRKCARS